MKRALILSIYLILIVHSVGFAKPVTIDNARIVAENWMMEQKLTQPGTTELLPASGEEQIFPQPGNQQFSLYRALNRGGVLANVEGETKEEVIRASMQHISEKLRHDSDVLSELLLDRERLMPTAFNNGVAVPHTRE